MNTGLNPGRLVREARLTARLTQRELARRAHTSQSVVARVESGQTSPSSETLERLLDAAGYELRVALQRDGGGLACWRMRQIGRRTGTTCSSCASFFGAQLTEARRTFQTR
jgi:transcriptional regulator with XRE-family HTH domain